jgi:hypothetical protein
VRGYVELLYRIAPVARIAHLGAIGAIATLASIDAGAPIDFAGPTGLLPAHVYTGHGLRRGV